MCAPFVNHFDLRRGRQALHLEHRDRRQQAHEDEHEREHAHEPAANRTITAFLVGLKSRGSALATLRSCADSRPALAQTSRIQTPTLVIWGHADALSPARFGQRLAREIRGAGFEQLDAGHAPQEERPREVARLVARFLEDGQPDPARHVRA